ncbi:hypothetical protein LINPERHAP1_LOCUS14520 [Linum perenne]
MEKGRR